MRSSVRAVLMSGGVAADFDPLSLFEGGTYDGFYIDFNQIAQQYQDDGATTPVTADGQSIGYYDDLSPNDNDAVQATAAAKPTFKTGSPNYASWDGNDHLDVDDSGNSLGVLDGDFTLMACARFGGDYETIVSKADTSYSATNRPNRWAFTKQIDESLLFLTTPSNGGSNSFFASTAGTIPVGTPCVVGAERSGTTVTLSLNGVAIRTGTVAGTFGDVADDVVIGRAWEGSSGWQKYLADRVYRLQFVNGRALDDTERLSAHRALGQGVVDI